MKTIKKLGILLVVLLILDIILVAVDDGSGLQSKKYDATVVSCVERSNTGLETYYTVEYTYKKGDETVSGKDIYYLEKVEKGDKITVSVRENVVTPFSYVQSWGMVILTVAVGCVTMVIVYLFIHSKEDKNSEE